MDSKTFFITAIVLVRLKADKLSPLFFVGSMVGAGKVCQFFLLCKKSALALAFGGFLIEGGSNGGIAAASR